jgi:hypothetical protein
MQSIFFKAIFLVLALFPLITFSQADSKPVLIMKTLHHSGGYLEPLFIHIELRNPGPDTMVYPIVSNEHRPVLEYKHMDSLNWIEVLGTSYTSFHKYNNKQALGRKQKKIVPHKYSRNRVFESSSVYPSTNAGDFSNDFIFRTPGIYLVRLKACPFFINGDCLYSTVDTLTIQPYLGVNKKAVKRFDKTGISNFIFEPFFTGRDLPVLPDFTTEAEFLLKKYEKSDFLPWIQYYISFRIEYKYFHEGQKNIEELLLAQSLLEKVLNDKRVENVFFIRDAEGFLFDIGVYINTSGFEKMRKN